MSLILNDLWNKESVWTVSKTYNLPRGSIHSFLSRTASYASSILRFTEVKIFNFHNVQQFFMCLNTEHMKIRGFSFCTKSQNKLSYFNFQALKDKKLDHFPMLFQNIVPKLHIGVLGCSSNLESLMSLPSVRFVSTINY